MPFNYKTLELNEALIDWFNPQQTYNDVIIAAANETGDGQGFVTEQARLTSDPQLGNITDALFQEQFTISDYRNNADSFSNAELIAEVATRFSVFNQFAFTGPFGGAAPQQGGQVSLDGVADVLTRNLDLPAGLAVADVIAAPRCYFEEFVTEDTFYCEGRPAPAERISLTGFNRNQFMTDVEDLVIEPIEETVQLFGDLPYMTRFYTTLSADEMTVDPSFVINSDLPDVSNQHSLELRYEGCFGDTSGAWEASVGGRIVRGEGSTWPLTLADRPDDMPVNLRILQLGVSGSGEVYEDNGDVIGGILEEEFGTSTPGGNGQTPGMDPAIDPGMNPTMTGGDDPMGMSPLGSMGSSGGCSIEPRSESRFGSAAAALLGLLAAGLLRRGRSA